jgi:hemolysin activation/secretion protein
VTTCACSPLLSPVAKSPYNNCAVRKRRLRRFSFVCSLDIGTGKGEQKVPPANCTLVSLGLGSRTSLEVS